MKRKSTATPLTAVLCLLVLVCSGCVSGDSQGGHQVKQQRRIALDRWHECIADQPEATLSVNQAVTAMQKRMRTCQGYRYDIVATYPRHLVPSVNRLLSKSLQQSLLSTWQARNLASTELPELARALSVVDAWDSDLESGRWRQTRQDP